MDILERLKASGESTVRATALLAEAKSKRNQAAGDEHAHYTGLAFSETMEAAAIAEIERLRGCEKQLRSFIEAFDAGQIELNSPEIQTSDEHPPHPWHEEWMAHARAALEQ